MPPRPTDLLGQRLLNAAERTYIINWLFTYGGSVDPTKLLAGGNFRDAANTGTDVNKVVAFLGAPTNYKLFNRLQIRYRKGANGFVGAPVILNDAVAVGSTVDPFGFAPYIHPGQFGPAATTTGAFVNTNRVAGIVDGSPDSAGIRVINTLAGKGVASPVFWENIGNKITFRYKGNASGSYTSPDIVVQPYPTHDVFTNGILSKVYGQALTPLANFNANPYPFGPGGRGGDAASPAVPTARIPLYTVP